MQLTEYHVIFTEIKLLLKFLTQINIRNVPLFDSRITYHNNCKTSSFPPKKRKKIANADFRIATPPPSFLYIYFFEFDPRCRIARERTEEEKVFFFFASAPSRKKRENKSRRLCTSTHANISRRN